jgi:hypothetical protein
VLPLNNIGSTILFKATEEIDRKFEQWHYEKHSIISDLLSELSDLFEVDDMNITYRKIRKKA